jgi:hypothetical protein
VPAVLFDDNDDGIRKALRLLLNDAGSACQ